MAATISRSITPDLGAKGSAARQPSRQAKMLHGNMGDSQFRQRVRDIVEAFSEMDDEITKEKRAMERICARRWTCTRWGLQPGTRNSGFAGGPRTLNPGAARN
jgi:hypothetical protein